MKYTRRWGRFRISNIMMEAIRAEGFESEAYQKFAALMGQCLIMKAENSPWDDSIEYWAISPLFEEVAEGGMIPEYSVEGRRFEVEEDCTECARYAPGMCTCHGLGKVTVVKYEFRAFKKVEPLLWPAISRKAVRLAFLEELRELLTEEVAEAKVDQLVQRLDRLAGRS